MLIKQCLLCSRRCDGTYLCTSCSTSLEDRPVKINLERKPWPKRKRKQSLSEWDRFKS